MSSPTAMGKKSSRLRRRSKKSQIQDINKAKSSENSNVLQKVSKDPGNSAYFYTIFAILAFIGAHVNAIGIGVPDDYTAKSCKYLFVILVCMNVRNHEQFKKRSWWIRGFVYFACNFAGATTICIARREIPAYLRQFQPWINVASAAFLVEMIMLNEQTSRRNSMVLRAICVLPVSLWKSKTLGRVVVDCYENSIPIHRTFPMVTADMFASGIMLLVLAYIDSNGLKPPQHLSQFNRLLDITQHVLVMGMISLLWKIESNSLFPIDVSLPWFYEALVLWYNLVKFCWIPTDYFLSTQNI